MASLICSVAILEVSDVVNRITIDRWWCGVVWCYPERREEVEDGDEEDTEGDGEGA